LADGPSVQDSVWEYYQSRNPGQVQMLGPDLYNGNSSQLDGFRAQTGATYPLLLSGASGSGNENLLIPYGQWDNYVVINKQGVIRYHAYDRWPHGNRYHLNEIRGAVDTLVTNLVGVGDDLVPRSYFLNVAPNPFHGSTTLELTNPTARDIPARITVHDVAGRLVATLWNAPAPRGRTLISWDGRSESGSAMGPGVYIVRANLGGMSLSRRVVRVR